MTDTSFRPPLPRRVSGQGSRDEDNGRRGPPVSHRPLPRTRNEQRDCAIQLRGSPDLECHRKQFIAVETEHRRSQSLPPTDPMARRENMLKSPLAGDQDTFILPESWRRNSSSKEIVRQAETSEKTSCELYPGSCYVYDSVALLIDLASSNGSCVTDQRCLVLFWGEQSGRKVEVDGFKRNHNYGVKTSSPVWYEQEILTVVVKTMAGRHLASGLFEVRARIHVDRPLPAVSACVQPENTRDVSFITDVLGAFMPDAVVSKSWSSSTPTLCGLVICLPESQSAVTEMLDRVIAFSLTNGLPCGVSILDMFRLLPNLKSLLEASHFAQGSLDCLLNTVRLQSRHEQVTEQISDLIKAAMSSSTDECRPPALYRSSSDCGTYPTSLVDENQDLDPTYEDINPTPIYDVLNPSPIYEDLNQILSEIDDICSTEIQQEPRGHNESVHSEIYSHKRTDRWSCSSVFAEQRRNGAAAQLQVATKVVDHPSVKWLGPAEHFNVNNICKTAKNYPQRREAPPIYKSVSCKVLSSQSICSRGQNKGFAQKTDDGYMPMAAVYSVPIPAADRQSSTKHRSIITDYDTGDTTYDPTYSYPNLMSSMAGDSRNNPVRRRIPEDHYDVCVDPN